MGVRVPPFAPFFSFNNLRLILVCAYSSRVWPEPDCIWRSHRFFCGVFRGGTFTSCTSWIAGRAHSQTQISSSRAVPAWHVSDLVRRVKCRFIEADEAVARSQILPDVLVGRNVGQANVRARWKRPRPGWRADVSGAHGRVQPVGLIHNVGSSE